VAVVEKIRASEERIPAVNGCCPAPSEYRIQRRIDERIARRSGARALPREVL